MNPFKPKNSKTPCLLFFSTTCCLATQQQGLRCFVYAGLFNALFSIYLLFKPLYYSKIRMECILDVFESQLGFRSSLSPKPLNPKQETGRRRRRIWCMRTGTTACKAREGSFWFSLASISYIYICVYTYFVHIIYIYTHKQLMALHMLCMYVCMHAQNHA